MATTDISSLLDSTADLDELLAVLRRIEKSDTVYDLSLLPTFGGQGSREAGVYSWGDERILVGPGFHGDSRRSFAVLPRN